MAMTIQFGFGNGHIAYDADAVIGMTMTNFRRFAQLFALHGTPEQHRAFLDLLRVYVSTESRKTYLTEYKQKLKVMSTLLGVPVE